MLRVVLILDASSQFVFSESGMLSSWVNTVNEYAGTGKRTLSDVLTHAAERFLEDVVVSAVLYCSVSARTFCFSLGLCLAENSNAGSRGPMSTALAVSC